MIFLSIVYIIFIRPYAEFLTIKSTVQNSTVQNLFQGIYWFRNETYKFIGL